MTEPQQLGVYEFDGYRLDVVERTLWEGTRRIELNGRAFDVLSALVRRAGKLVTKDELFRVAWHGRVVEEGNLHVQISNLRKVLGRQAITTVSRYGYRLEAVLRTEDSRGSDDWSDIPAPVSPLIGRAEELESLHTLLRHHRLVTIKGMGGLGKSRLAIAAGRSLIIDGKKPRCWYINLSLTYNENDIDTTAIETPTHPLFGNNKTSYFSAIRESPTLLIIDGCELISESVAKTSRILLEKCPELAILCTSRRSLGLHEEHIYECPPLNAEEARTLFIERLGLEGSHFAEQRADIVSAVDRILPRLEGVALAIEIAAGLMKRVGSSWLEDHLPSRMNSLAGLDPSLPERQRTLDATIEWSYRLLSPTERRFLNRISVLQRPFTILDGEVIGVEPNDLKSDLLQTIIGLIDNSFLIKETKGEQLRYRVPESIRAYAQSILAASPDRESTVQARNRWAKRLLEGSVLSRGGVDWRNRMKQLSAAYQDVLTALYHSASNNSWEEASEIAYGLFPFWVDANRLEEGLKITRELIKKAPSTTGRVYHQLIHAVGGLTQDLGDYSESDKCLGAAVQEYKLSLDSQPILAIALNEWGVTKQYLGQHEEAGELYAEALDLSIKLGLSRNEVQVRSNLAVLRCFQDRFDMAEGILIEALELHQRLADPKGHALCKSWLSACRLEAGDLPGYLELSKDAVSIYRPMPEDLLTGALFHRLASALAVNGNIAEASRYWRAAESITVSFSNERAVVELLEAAATVLEAARKVDLALRLNTFLTQICSARQGFMSPVRRRRLAASATRLNNYLGSYPRNKRPPFSAQAGFNPVLTQVRQELADLP